MSGWPGVFKYSVNPSYIWNCVHFRLRQMIPLLFYGSIKSRIYLCLPEPAQRTFSSIFSTHSSQWPKGTWKKEIHLLRQNNLKSFVTVAFWQLMSSQCPTNDAPVFTQEQRSGSTNLFWWNTITASKWLIKKRKCPFIHAKTFNTA